MDEDVTPKVLARKLGVSEKTFRSWLRGLWLDGDERLADHRLHERWVFTPPVARELESDFRRLRH